MKLDWDCNDINSYYDNDINSYYDIGNIYSPILCEKITSAGQVYIRQILTYDYPDYIGDLHSWDSNREIYEKLKFDPKWVSPKKGKSIISDIDPFGEELWYD